MTSKFEVNRISACTLQMVYVQCSRKRIQLLKNMLSHVNGIVKKRKHLM
jgi:hypothetical protein